MTASSEHNFFVGFSRNVSAGGIFIATHNLLPIGHEVELKFYLPKGDCIMTRGLVQWVRDYNEATDTSPGMGIQFTGLGQDDIARIEQVIATREPLIYEDF